MSSVDETGHVFGIHLLAIRVRVFNTFSFRVAFHFIGDYLWQVIPSFNKIDVYFIWIWKTEKKVVIKSYL